MYMGFHEVANPLAVAAADLTTSYAGASSTAWMAVEGTQEIHADVSATGKAGTAVTSAEFQFQGSNDGGTTPQAIATRLVEDQLPAAEVTLAVTASTTTKKSIVTDAHGSFKLVRLASKITGGPAADADATACSLLRVRL